MGSKIKEINQSTKNFNCAYNQIIKERALSR